MDQPNSLLAFPSVDVRGALCRGLHVHAAALVARSAAVPLGPDIRSHLKRRDPVAQKARPAAIPSLDVIIIEAPFIEPQAHRPHLVNNPQRNVNRSQPAFRPIPKKSAPG